MATVRHLGLFPWCPLTVEAEAGKTSLPLRLALAAWWRVKSWRFTINYTGQVTEDGETFSHGELHASYIVERGETVIDDPEFFERSGAFVGTEKNLVCDKQGGAETTYTGFQSTPSGSFRFDFVNLPGDTPVQILQNNEDGLWILGASFEMNTVLSGGFLGNTVTAGPNFTEVGTFTFSMFDEELTSPINLIRFRPDLGGATYFCDAKIEPHSFFAYDPGDGGGPIYDSTTGAQLRGFPN